MNINVVAYFLRKMSVINASSTLSPFYPSFLTHTHTQKYITISPCKFGGNNLIEKDTYFQNVIKHIMDLYEIKRRMRQKFLSYGIFSPEGVVKNRACMNLPILNLLMLVCFYSQPARSVLLSIRLLKTSQIHFA